jgi:voltage-gated potassium channel
VVDDPWRRVQLGLLALAMVLVVGTIGYLLLGLSPLDAAYQTVTTVSTVGFREIGTSDGPYKVFTMVLILTGVGVVLYTLTVLLETLLEGRLTHRLWRRRMDRDIARMRDHVIVCGYGRLGRTIADHLAAAGRELVVIERAEHVLTSPFPHVHGDANDDAVLEAAGVDRAATLIAALDSDSQNLYLTLSARSRRPDLFIIARARLESAEPKLRQAGADRVVNPQLIGGTRIAAMTLQPHVLEFVDVVFHDGSLEFRLEEIPIGAGSVLDGRTIGEVAVRDRTGAMVLAVREPTGTFVTNPTTDTRMAAGQVLIAIGTSEQLAALASAASGPAGPRR